MLKRTFTFIFSILTVFAVANADTSIPAGNVSGIFNPEGSPYIIEGDISIPAGEFLLVEAGVTVFFDSWYQLTVNGTLTVAGTENEPVLFTANPPGPGEPGWLGLRFQDATVPSVINYAIFENAKATAAFPNNSGAAIYIGNSDPYIKNSIFRNNQAGTSGGAIFMIFSSPLIENNTFVDNFVGYNFNGAGGAIYSNFSRPEIINNTFINNSVNSNSTSWVSHADGGAILMIDSPDALVQNNLFVGNSVTASGNIGTSANGGAISLINFGARIINNTFIDNSTIIFSSVTDGGTIDLEGSSPLIQNNIFANNPGGGISFSSPSDGEIKYNAFHSNGGDFVGSYVSGDLGVISTVNANGDPSDNFYNIFQDPLFADPANGDYTLQSNSPAIDAGDPSSVIDPDGTVADLGAFYFSLSPPAELTIVLTPASGSIIIPSEGGSFEYDVAISNPDPSPVVFDVWIDVTLPNGSVVGPLVLRNTLNLPPGGQIARNDLIQSIPGNAPEGIYSYNAYAGNYPDAILSTDSFTFEKTGTAQTGRIRSGWELDGWDGQNSFAEVTPADYRLVSPYPNPFNPSATVAFELPEASKIFLAVYDIQGRQVAVLENGLVNSGIHERTFHGNQLASGIYFARLNAGGQTFTQKMMLVK